MPIYRPDGTPYTALGSLNQIQPDSPSHDFFQSWDAEIIELGGSPLLYYEVIIPSASIDMQYLESRNKLWSQHPTENFGVYDPIPSETSMTMFGADSPNDSMVFYCNYKDTLSRIGHLPMIGSRLYTPHLRENWEIVNRKLGDFHRWKVYRIEIYCVRWQENLTTGEGKVAQGTPSPGFKID